MCLWDCLFIPISLLGWIRGNSSDVSRHPYTVISLLVLFLFRSLKHRLTSVGTRCTDHATPLYQQKLALASRTSGGRSVGIVRLLTESHGVCCLFYFVAIQFVSSGFALLVGMWSESWEQCKGAVSKHPVAWRMFDHIPGASVSVPEHTWQKAGNSVNEPFLNTLYHDEYLTIFPQLPRQCLNTLYHDECLTIFPQLGRQCQNTSGRKLGTAYGAVSEHPVSWRMYYHIPGASASVPKHTWQKAGNRANELFLNTLYHDECLTVFPQLSRQCLNTPCRVSQQRSQAVASWVGRPRKLMCHFECDDKCWEEEEPAATLYIIVGGSSRVNANCTERLVSLKWTRLWRRWVPRTSVMKCGVSEVACDCSALNWMVLLRMGKFGYLEATATGQNNAHE
jgi:hypothetical protein